MKVSAKFLCCFCFLAGILISVTGCSSNYSSSTMTLSCDLRQVLRMFAKGAKVDSVIIQTYTADGDFSDIGTAVIDGKKAVFTTNIDSPAIGRVKYCLTVPGGTEKSAKPFVAEAGTITVDLSSGVKGSNSNDAIAEVLKRIQNSNESPVAIKDLFTDFAAKHNEVASIMLFVNSFPLIDNEIWLSTVESMEESISNHPLINDYKAEAHKLVALSRARTATAIGSKYADFEGEWDGHKYALSDYVKQGKYVLVDFWASWCGPCKEEIPYLIRANDKYKDKGLVVLGVAVSDKPEDTARAKNSLGINYTVFNESNSSASNAYGIQSIPQILLIGPDGTIIADNLRGEDIEKTISQYLE